MRGEGFKLIEAPRAELYRVSEDPGETRNLMEARASVATGMRARLGDHLRRDEAPAAASSAVVDAAAAERLAALGYVGGGFFAGKPSGADPKDKIGEYQAYRRDTLRALRLFRDRDLDGAIRLLTRLSRAARPEGANVLERRSFNVEYFLGRSLVEKGRYAEAVPHLEGALTMAPTSVPAHVFLAQALGGARRPADALAVIDKGLLRAPDNPELLQARGGLLLRRGDLAGARAALEMARERDPASVSLRVDLATVYRNQGSLDQAGAAVAEALRLEPRSPQALVERALVQGALGREAEAVAALRQALEAVPDHADALYYLGAIELRAGRARAALPLLERLAKTAPGYPGGQQALEAALAATGADTSASSGVRSAPAPATIRLRLMRLSERAAAEDAVRRARAGEDFAALARASSVDPTAANGGDLGRVLPRDLAEPLRSAARALKPGETSDAIETANGWVILQRLR